MPKVKQSTERLQLIDELIAGKRKIIGREALVAELNKRLDEPISVSSLDKDLRYLRELLDAADPDVKLIVDPVNGYRYSEPGYSYFKLAITESDRQFLELGYNLFDLFSGTPLQEEYGHLIEKLLTNKLSPRARASYQKRAVTLSDRRAIPGQQWIKVLIDAIINKEPLLMKYRSRRSSKIEQKRISPYFLKPYQGGWYLVAYDEDCAREEKTNVYALHSIQSIKVSNHAFRYPDFDINEYFTHSLGIWHRYDKPPVVVRLEFSDLIDEIQLNPIHPTQKIIDNNGPLVIEVCVFDTPELERLILGYGDTVKVIEPKSLARKIIDTAKRIAGIYDSSL